MNKQVSFLPEFAHLNNLLVGYLKEGHFTIDEIYEIGSRFSGKTFGISTACILMCIGRQTQVFAFRKMTGDLNETIENFKGVADELGIKYVWYATLKIIEFENGSRVKFKGLHTQNDKRAKLTGLADVPKGFAIIRWYEEAYEFSPEDIKFSGDAVRGGNGERLVIYTCNPWSPYNHLIKYCMSKLPFSKDKLNSIGNQYLRLVENVENTRDHTYEQVVRTFNYTNWRINKYLNVKQVLDIEKTKNMSPSLANAAYYGIPSMSGGLIFGDLVNRIKLPDFAPYEFVGGIDYGVAESATTFSFWGRDMTGQRMVKLDEWYHSNKTSEFMEPTDMATCIFNEINQLTYDFPKIKNGLTIYVDYAATGFMSILRKEAAMRNMSFVDIQPSYKPDVLYAINWMYCAMSNQNIYWERQYLPHTIEEYSIMQWDIKPNTEEVKPLKINDHCYDADKYAIFGAGWHDHITMFEDTTILRKARW